jgi:hypothetical protein
LRRNWPYLTLLYTGGLFFTGNHIAVPIALFLLSLVTTGFYLECENRGLLQLFARKRPDFLAACPWCWHT